MSIEPNKASLQTERIITSTPEFANLASKNGLNAVFLVHLSKLKVIKMKSEISDEDLSNSVKKDIQEMDLQKVSKSNVLEHVIKICNAFFDYTFAARIGPAVENNKTCIDKYAEFFGFGLIWSQNNAIKKYFISSAFELDRSKEATEKKESSSPKAEKKDN